MRKCKHCIRMTNSSDSVARLAGWRWYDGPTQSGGWLTDVVCPTCAGTVAPAEQVWDVICWTCGWSYQEEHDPDDSPLTKPGDAVELGRDHECEPDVRLKTPDGQLYDLSNFDRNGKLRQMAGPIR